MLRSAARALGYALIALVLTKCSDPTSPTPIPVELGAPQLSVDDTGPYPILAGAGDIGNCTVGNDNDESTARLLDAIFANGQPGNVMMIGDADESAVTDNYPSCYAETWGRHLAITRPAPGNTDYINATLDRYFNYFGSAAGPAPGGYYSFDVGPSWHVVVINSNNNFVPTNADATPQVTWLRNDLLLNTKPCIAAFMHHPRFTSRTSATGATEEGSLRPVWNELYKHGAEFVASGHRHQYERFKPMRADGTVDLALGVIQFIVGTGGVSLGLPQEGVGQIHPNSEVRGIDYGVMKFTLEPEGYDWEFVPARNRFNDAGSANCHPPTIPVSLLVSSSSPSSVYGQPVTFTAKAEDGSNFVRVGTVSFITGGTCEQPGTVLASGIELDLTGRARATVSTLDVVGSPHAITACYAGAGSYMSSSGSVAHSVTQAPATVTLDALETTYDGQPKNAFASTDPTGLSVSFAYIDAAGVAVAEPVDAGDYTVTVTVDDANYSGSASDVFRISRATPTITWPAPASIAYGTPLSEVQLNATASFNSEPVPGSFAYTPPAGTVLDVGPNQVLSADFTPTAAGNFNGVTGTTVLITVGGAGQTIDFASPGDRTFGDPPFELLATATSGLPVSYSALGECSVAGSTVTILAAGSCTITASQGGDGNYQPAENVVRSILIAKKAASVTLGSLFHNYDGQVKSATATTDALGESSFQFEYWRNGTTVAQPTDAGAYGVVATLVNANYQGLASGILIINAAPVAVADAYSIDEDGTLSVAAPAVLGNDSDANGDALTALLVSSTSNATLQLNADGSFTYVPALDFSGIDGFTYRVSDGNASSNAVSVTITVNPVNDAPVGVAETYKTDEDTPLSVSAPGVLGNDTDVDVGQTLQAVLVIGPSHGTLTLNANGSLSYVPAIDYNGNDAFTYQASDGIAMSAPVTVAIHVKAVDDLISVKVDMVPGSSTNTVSLSGTQTQIVFAVLSSSAFDATLTDASRVTVGNGTGAEAGLARNADGTFKFTLVDVNGDGRRDFFAYVDKADLRNNGDLTLTTKTLTVSGALNAPSTTLFRGSDKVNVVR
jgi:hypothetical protein